MSSLGVFFSVVVEAILGYGLHPDMGSSVAYLVLKNLNLNPEGKKNVYFHQNWGQCDWLVDWFLWSYRGSNPIAQYGVRWVPG